MSMGDLDDTSSETPLIFEIGRPGRRGSTLPAPDVPEKRVDAMVPKRFLRESPADLPEVSELQTARHYVWLSRKNFSIDSHFYPLGSCTMKYNPKVNEAVANLPGFRDAHPLQDPSQVQGVLQIFWELERILSEISGLPHITLQPAAGAHGELTSLMILRAYYRDRGEKRDTVLIPDSAHGTNPASCSIVGFRTLEVRSGKDGLVDLDDFRKKVDRRTVALMITNPNTLGLFERNIEEIAEILHGEGAMLYMDGANLNALLGIARPGDFGVDVMHFNLHKTFSTPHGGGGPGCGPVGVIDALAPFLPVPRIEKEDEEFRLDFDRPSTIGKVKSHYGHTGMVVRAYTYIRSHSPETLREISRQAVLNANYLLSLLRDRYDAPFEGPCMHEAVFSASRQKEKGVRALDIAKRLLDLGFHPPTIYFPLIVPECLMIEPTETEGKETLDLFAKAMIQIADESQKRPELVMGAPRRMPISRPDEVAAAR
ncbi:MAG: aminomethyl-transferring glycine dehydrogenase subunit GcvPB, partial [Planctomycetota bacterium]|nr:aminomethyl-transferring glycine dehydrogenase subunit GcvPB [Planctomycetota bacterium]